MKKLVALIVIFVTAGCSTTKTTISKPLYEVLTINADGGANIKFYEILTEPKEIMMLLSDETLRQKIKKDDTTNSSFIILNSGPTTEKSNKIKIEKVEETQNEINIYITDTQKNIAKEETNDDTFYPYMIVKINSKKPIKIK